MGADGKCPIIESPLRSVAPVVLLPSGTLPMPTPLSRPLPFTLLPTLTPQPTLFYECVECEITQSEDGRWNVLAAATDSNEFYK